MLFLVVCLLRMFLHPFDCGLFGVFECIVFFSVGVEVEAVGVVPELGDPDAAAATGFRCVVADSVGFADG